MDGAYSSSSNGAMDDDNDDPTVMKIDETRRDDVIGTMDSVRDELLGWAKSPA